MKHTIICWDCCYRNFFWTAHALADQAYDKAEYQLIYVEQRSKARSDQFNHAQGLDSLSDVIEGLRGSFQVKALYLNDDTGPYHIGRTVNAALERAVGEIVSIMDGDVLVEQDFLTKLDHEHQKSSKAVVNLYRLAASRPVGVPFDRWTEQRPDFRACAALSTGSPDRIPQTVGNKGPMISARLTHWQRINGYDEHRIWSTGLARAGQDATARLEVLLSTQSYALPTACAVHPWHTQGFRRDTVASVRMLSALQDLIDWAVRECQADWRARLDATEAVYAKNGRFIDRMIDSELGTPGLTAKRLTGVRGRASAVLRRGLTPLRSRLKM